MSRSPDFITYPFSVYETAPLTVESVTQARTVERSTVANVYTRILADLDEADTKLPATRAGNLQATRVNKSAAIALKQRLRLHQGNWGAVVTEGNKLIQVTTTFTSPIGGHPLAATPCKLLFRAARRLSWKTSSSLKTAPMITLA
jgi:hypothetical protein